MTDPTETARALLYRYGVPEDIVDGALALHAQELAALQRLRMDELDLTGQKARLVGRIVDLIDPTRTPAWPAVPVPPADRAALRERIAEARDRLRGMALDLATGSGLVEPKKFDEALDAYRDVVLASVLPAPADRAVLLLDAADDLATAFGDPMVKHIGLLGAAHLRRRARELRRHAAEAQQTAPDPGRQRAYDAVYAYIRQLGGQMPTSQIDRNAIIWHAVNAALDACPKLTPMDPRQILGIDADDAPETEA